MNTSNIPTPQDEVLRIEGVVGTPITKTASFAGTTFDSGAGFRGGGGVGLPMGAVVNVSACDRASGDETYTFTLQESDDDSTYNDAGPGVAVTVASTVATLGNIVVPGFVSKRYQKLKLVCAGTTPSITYEAWLNPNVCG